MKRVLLAGSDPGLQSALVLLLKHKLGILDICVTGDAGQVGERLAGFQPDVLLLDWELPGLDIAAVRDAIQRARTRPVVIVMSIQPENETCALANGADAFLNKHAPGETVLNFLRRYVAGA
jgi:DNA-binding NarL/FixJ family response regulator